MATDISKQIELIPNQCPSCHGRMIVVKIYPSGFENMIPCPTCEGKGLLTKERIEQLTTKIKLSSLYGRFGAP